MTVSLLNVFSPINYTVTEGFVDSLLRPGSCKDNSFFSRVASFFSPSFHSLPSLFPCFEACWVFSLVGCSILVFYRSLMQINYEVFMKNSEFNHMFTFRKGELVSLWAS